jgi:hypothetical protein
MLDPETFPVALASRSLEGFPEEAAAILAASTQRCGGVVARLNSFAEDVTETRRRLMEAGLR